MVNLWVSSFSTSVFWEEQAMADIVITARPMIVNLIDDDILVNKTRWLVRQVAMLIGRRATLDKIEIFPAC